MEIRFKVKVAALVVFVLFFCNRGAAYPFMHCGVWVISFEPKTDIVAGSMRQQQIITVQIIGDENFYWSVERVLLSNRPRPEQP